VGMAPGVSVPNCKLVPWLCRAVLASANLACIRARVSMEAFPGAVFDVLVNKDDFKFNCAHFVAFRGYRERIHGHNYHVSVRMVGQVRSAHVVQPETVNADHAGALGGGRVRDRLWRH
jgi:hypothetical protein